MPTLDAARTAGRIACIRETNAHISRQLVFLRIRARRALLSARH